MEAHNGTSWNTQAEMDYNGLGQRLRMDAAGVIAHYVMDTSTSASTGSARRLSASFDRPLTAETGGSATFYLYGLGVIGEKTTAWNYSLPDGANPSITLRAGTPRQLIDMQGEITLFARYTPWGDSLELHGTGNPSTGSGQAFSFGYPSIELRAGFGGVLDAATGLLYVGNGQYGVYPERSRRDPSTGRFLTRDVRPNSPNPYVPWNPIGAIVGPLGLIALVFGRKKKGSKAGTFLVALLVVGSVGMTLAGCGGGFPYEPEPPLPPSPLEDTPIISAPWVDEMDQQNWNQYPNSCGPAALYMFLKAEGIDVSYPVLIDQLRQEQPGGYDGYCCSSGWGRFPTPTPNPSGVNTCNEACTSAEVLADVARKYYGLLIQSGDGWTRNRVHQSLMAGHPVLALVRSEFRATSNYFGHFVLIRGLIDQGTTVVVNDSYPGEAYWNVSSKERQAVGEGRRVDWYEFDKSWASFVDSMDPLGGPNFKGHVRWAMAVK